MLRGNDAEDYIKEIDNSTQKTFESIMDVLLVHKARDLKYLSVNQSFTYDGRTFEKNDVLEIVDDDGHKNERKRKLKVKRYNNNDDTCFYLPCYIEGKFSMYSNQVKDEKSAQEETLNSLVYESINCDNSIDTFSEERGESIVKCVYQPSKKTLLNTTVSDEVVDGIDNEFCPYQDVEYVEMRPAKKLSSLDNMGYVTVIKSDVFRRCRRNFATQSIDDIHKAEDTGKNQNLTLYQMNRAMRSKLIVSKNDFHLLRTLSKSQIEEYRTHGVCNLLKFLAIEHCIDTVMIRNISGKILLTYNEEDFKSDLGMNPIEARMMFNYIQCNWRPKLTSTKGDGEILQPCQYSVQDVQKHLEDFNFTELATYTKKYRIDGEMMHLLLLDDCLLTLQFSNGCPVLKSYEYGDLRCWYGITRNE